ncbi:hypothetical protein [Stappia indica]|jgi:hypothetical protein|uniref:Uncharacterized protein n=1 Tax=Stappia indica TaxID=538381 RepID=A0A857CBX8_9HYPH|nr:hypothetical protein [Stappia indica]QGZ36337.1 hypothetical protein GH266_18720 [Stappia indica]
MTLAVPTLGEGHLSADRLVAANINPRTGLATDYLNHFNEVVMLLEMLPDMPDCVEDVLDWQPLSYEQHFEASNFAEKHLAVEAFRAAPAAVRKALKDVVATLDTAVCEKQGRLRESDDIAAVAPVIALQTVEEVKPLIATASAIIHGHLDPASGTETDSQASIDALFA